MVESAKNPIWNYAFNFLHNNINQGVEQKAKGQFEQKPVTELPPVPVDNAERKRTNPESTATQPAGASATQADNFPAKRNNPGSAPSTQQFRRNPEVATFGNISDRQPKIGVERMQLVQDNGAWFEMDDAHGRKPANGTYYFAVQNGEIFVSRQGDLEASKGERVTYAGQAHFSEEGALERWDNRAPSYAPAAQYADRADLPMDKFARNKPGADGLSLDRLLKQVQVVQDADLDSLYRGYYRGYSHTPAPQSLTPLWEGGRDVAKLAHIDRLLEIQERRPHGTEMYSQVLDDKAVRPLHEVISGKTYADRYDLSKANRDFFHYISTVGSDKDVKTRIYINADIDHLPDVTKFIVSEIVDQPTAYPGVYEVKASGADIGARRSDNIVIYVDTPENRQRVLTQLKQYHEAHPDHFKSDTPAMTKPYVSGIGIGDEPNQTMVAKANRILLENGLISEARSQYSFGSIRAFAIALAHHDATKLTQSASWNEAAIDFNTKLKECVRQRFMEFGIDPESPSKNLLPGRQMPVFQELRTGRATGMPASHHAPDGARSPVTMTSDGKTSIVKSGHVTVEYSLGERVKLTNIDMQGNGVNNKTKLAKLAKDFPTLTQIGSLTAQTLVSVGTGVALHLQEKKYVSALERASKEFHSEFPSAATVMREARIEELRKAYDDALRDLKAPNKFRTAAAMMAALGVPEDAPEAYKNLSFEERVIALEEDLTRRAGGRSDVRRDLIDAREAYFDALEAANMRLVQLAVRLPTEMAAEIDDAAKMLHEVSNDLERTFHAIVETPGGMLPPVYYSALDLYSTANTLENLGDAVDSFGNEISKYNKNYQKASDLLEREFMRVSTDLERTEHLLVGVEE